MTTRLYDLNSYVRECGATVVSCQPHGQGWAVALDQTCFFPEGGGQPADTGFLDETPVTHTWEEGDTILHLCAAPLAAGARVHGRIDFARRFAHMQTHSGEHVLSGLALREWGRNNVGFHMGAQCATVDFDGPLGEEALARLEALANEEVTKDRPVSVSYPAPGEAAGLPLRKRPQVEHLRVVAIEGCDCCGCCGTHVARTGEIGLIKILGAQRYKGGTRLSFLCGGAALADYGDKHAAVRALGEAFSCKPPEVLGAVMRQRQELLQLKERLCAQNRRLCTLLCREALGQGEDIGPLRWAFFWDEALPAQDIRELARQAAGEPGVLCTAVSAGGEGCHYAFAKSPDVQAPSLRELCQGFNGAFGGRGGGNESLCCGTLSPAGREEVRRMLREALRAALGAG